MKVMLLYVGNPYISEGLSDKKEQEMAVRSAERVLGIVHEDDILDFTSKPEWVQTALIRKDGQEVQACRVKDFCKFPEYLCPLLIAFDGKMHSSWDYATPSGWEMRVRAILSKAGERVTNEEGEELDPAWIVAFQAEVQ